MYMCISQWSQHCVRRHIPSVAAQCQGGFGAWQRVGGAGGGGYLQGVGGAEVRGHSCVCGICARSYEHKLPLYR